MKHLSLIAAEFVKIAKKIRNDPKHVHKETGKSTQIKAKNVPQSVKKNIDNKNKTEEQFLKQYGDKQVRNPDPKGKKKTISLKSLKSRHYKEYKQMFDSWRGGKKKQDDKKTPIGKKAPTKKIDKKKKIESAKTLRKKEKSDIDRVRNKIKETKRNWFGKLPADRQQAYLKKHPDSKKKLEKRRLEDKIQEKKKDLVEKKPENVPEKSEKKKSITLSDKSKQNYEKIEKQIQDNASKLAGSVKFLANPPKPSAADIISTRENVNAIDDAFEKIKLNATVDDVTVGPVFSTYHVKFDLNDLKKVTSNTTADKLELALHKRVIVKINKEKGTADIELQNNMQTPIVIKELLTDPKFIEQSKDPKKMPIILGKNKAGEVETLDLSDERSPHGLIVGQTGAGKSVLLQQIVASTMYGKDSDDLKLILLDPKGGAEFGRYDESEYLDRPVAKDPRDSVRAVKELAKEMNDRYALFNKAGVSNVNDFNTLVTKNTKDMTEDEKQVYNNLDETERHKIPKKVLICDELSDLMDDPNIRQNMIRYVTALGRKARASGIHMVFATQKPEKRVIPAAIQANLPAKIIMKVDSPNAANYVDTPGAEKLLGRGDMIIKGIGEDKRVQSGYVSEIDDIAKEFGGVGKVRHAEKPKKEKQIETAEPAQAHYDAVPDEPEELKQFRDDMKKLRETLARQREALLQESEIATKRVDELLAPSEKEKELRKKIEDAKENLKKQDESHKENMRNIVRDRMPKEESKTIDNTENDMNAPIGDESMDMETGETPEKDDEEFMDQARKEIEQLTDGKPIENVINEIENEQKKEEKDIDEPKKTLTQRLREKLFGKRKSQDKKESSTKLKKANDLMTDKEFESFLKKIDL